MSEYPPYPTDPADRTFASYVKGCIDQAPCLPDGFDRRLCLSVDRIDGLAKFQVWTRHRWPEWYTRRGDKGKGPTGQQHIANIWSHYLRWAEAE